MCTELDISLSDEQVARIVDSTFEEADLDHNDLIDLQEYQVRPSLTCLWTEGVRR